MFSTHHTRKNTSQGGFTLLEILLVIALIAILATITIVALNPTRQYGQANNTTRLSHVNTILNAINQYSVDNAGSIPSTVPTSGTCNGASSSEICQTGSACATGVDLSVLTASEIYLVSVPVNPSTGSATGTGYHVVQSTNGRVTVCSPTTDLGTSISVQR